MTEQYRKALVAIDEVNNQDPQTEVLDGEEFPKEYLYAKRMVEMLEWFYPQADEAQMLAARCQHLYRWEIPRSQYPEGKAGYHKWRTFLYTYQAEKTVELLAHSGFGAEVTDRVFAMVAKKGIKSNADTQLIEDVICLVFIRFYVEEFAERYRDDMPKLYAIIQKTWKKMSETGQAAVNRLELKPELLSLLNDAIAGK